MQRAQLVTEGHIQEGSECIGQMILSRVGVAVQVSTALNTLELLQAHFLGLRGAGGRGRDPGSGHAQGPGEGTGGHSGSQWSGLWPQGCFADSSTQNWRALGFWGLKAAEI